MRTSLCATPQIEASYEDNQLRPACEFLCRSLGFLMSLWSSKRRWKISAGCLIWPSSFSTVSASQRNSSTVPPSRTENICHRAPVDLQRVENDRANALVLDAIGRTSMQIHQVGERFVGDQFEEPEVARNRPAVGPELWREQQGPVNSCERLPTPLPTIRRQQSRHCVPPVHRALPRLTCTQSIQVVAFNRSPDPP
jgi:hypothetical protein